LKYLLKYVRKLRNQKETSDGEKEKIGNAEQRYSPKST